MVVFSYNYDMPGDLTAVWKSDRKSSIPLSLLCVVLCLGGGGDVGKDLAMGKVRLNSLNLNFLSNLTELPSSLYEVITRQSRQ